MRVEWIGVVLTTLTVGTIAFGHVLVKRLHARFGTRPGIPLLVLGLIVIAASVFSLNDTLSAALGILGITTFWDGIEIFQQEKRILRDQALEVD
jgi:hypothetical protein